MVRSLVSPGLGSPPGVCRSVGRPPCPVFSPERRGVALGCCTMREQPTPVSQSDVRPGVPAPTSRDARRGAPKKEYTSMKALLRNLVIREEGQDLVEYALLAALPPVAAILAPTNLGPVTSNVWDRINTAISSV